MTIPATRGQEWWQTLGSAEQGQVFRACIEDSADQVILYDRDLRRVYVNQAVADAYHTPAGELIGRAIGEGLGTSDAPRWKQELDQIRERLRRVLSTGAPAEHEISWTTPGGRKHYHSRFAPQRDCEGQVIGVLAIARDITASREAERQFRSLAENAPDLIVRCDPEGRTLYVNEATARAVGASAAELLGTRIGDLSTTRTGTVPEGIMRLRAAVAEVGRTGSALTLEVVIPALDGEERTHSCRILPERDEAGELTSVLMICQDVTASRHSEEARRQLVGELMRAREEERGAVAHHLHNELGQSVLALLYGLERIVRLDDLAEAKRHAERLRKISAETLDGLRRLAHGLHSTALQDLGLAAALEQCAEEFAESFRLPVDLAVDGFATGRLPKPMEAGLYRITLEALTNVARHSGATRASVVLSRQGATVDLIVEDDGKGFDPGLLLGTPGAPHAFGLRGIIESANLLGGTARIESTPDGGTTVAVRVPCVDD